MLLPGLTHSSTSARRFHFGSVIGSTPKSVAILFDDHPVMSAMCDPGKVVAEARGIRPGAMASFQPVRQRRANSDVT